MEKMLKPVWTLDDALELVRNLQPWTRDYAYHLAIGGGVVNTGSSLKDLDLYFLPLDNDGFVPRTDALLDDLQKHFGPYEPIVAPEYAHLHSFYRHKVKFENAGKRIDAFIL